MQRDTLAELRAELRMIEDLRSVVSVLEWDQQTHMPSGGAESRGRQMALIGRQAHERLISDRVGELLDALRSTEEADSVDGGLVRAARREFERARRVPADLVDAIKSHGSMTYGVWLEARRKNDFALVRPYLEKTVELSRRYADCFPEAEHPADPMIDAVDPGMTAQRVELLFAELRNELVPIVQAIGARPRPETSFLKRHYPKAAQLALSEEVLRVFGYDRERGRQDETAHPFMTRFSAGDVRITTRFDEADLTEALFSTMHEVGHALYEQHVDPGFDASPLGRGTSSGVHESQSRTWENLVGRGRPFWEHFLPTVQRYFPEQLAEVDVDAIHRAINLVEPSLIRTAADEVTYNLHVMLRVSLEAQLLEGELAVADLPDAWNARMQSDLGVAPPTMSDGCLQDVHWYCDMLGGGFQCYTLGNLMSAQIYDAAVAAVPEIPTSIAVGNLTPLRTWLAENVYVHGARYLPDELLERVTGRKLEVKPLVSYLRAKYFPLYGIA